jgi:hypothetical protein
MEIEEKVNPGTEKRQFSKIPFENSKNMQSQIVVCDSRDHQLSLSNTQHNMCQKKRQNQKVILPMIIMFFPTTDKTKGTTKPALSLINH